VKGFNFFLCGSYGLNFYLRRKYKHLTNLKIIEKSKQVCGSMEENISFWQKFGEYFLIEVIKITIIVLIIIIMAVVMGV